MYKNDGGGVITKRSNDAVGKKIDRCVALDYAFSSLVSLCSQGTQGNKERIGISLALDMNISFILDIV